MLLKSLSQQFYMNGYGDMINVVLPVSNSILQEEKIATNGLLQRRLKRFCKSIRKKQKELSGKKIDHQNNIQRIQENVL